MIPSWLLNAVSWCIIGLGAVGTVALAGFLVWVLCVLAGQGRRYAWEFMWFLAWRTHRRLEKPTLAKQLDAAKTWAEQKERECRDLHAKRLILTHKLEKYEKVESSDVLTDHELDCIQNIGRDEKNNHRTIGLPELDALVNSYRFLKRELARATR